VREPSKDVGEQNEVYPTKHHCPYKPRHA
jgi:hypothetical protein